MNYCSIKFIEGCTIYLPLVCGCLCMFTCIEVIQRRVHVHASDYVCGDQRLIMEIFLHYSYVLFMEAESLNKSQSSLM